MESLDNIIYFLVVTQFQLVKKCSDQVYSHLIGPHDIRNCFAVIQSSFICYFPNPVHNLLIWKLCYWKLKHLNSWQFLWKLSISSTCASHPEWRRRKNVHSKTQSDKKKFCKLSLSLLFLEKIPHVNFKSLPTPFKIFIIRIISLLPHQQVWHLQIF